MDAELLALQQQFLAAQEVKAKARLSDRNVVELVAKLKQMGLLGDDLLHSLNGKEYITQEHLQREVEEEVRGRGRVSLVDLAALLNVDLFHVERAAAALLGRAEAGAAMGGADVQLVGGELVTSAYWDSLADEVDVLLQEAGQLAAPDLAMRFGVSLELLLDVLKARTGSRIRGKLEGHQLYTSAYVSRVKAVVRGGARAVTTPLALSQLRSVLLQGFADEAARQRKGAGGGGGRDAEGDRAGGGFSFSVESGLFASVFAECAAEGVISGSTRAGGMWTPAVFSRLQAEAVRAFLAQNRYVTYDAVRQLSVPQPKAFLRQLLLGEGVEAAASNTAAAATAAAAAKRKGKGPPKEGQVEGQTPGAAADFLFLDSAAVHSSVLLQLEAAVEEAVAAGRWLDASSVLPPALSHADCSSLVARCPHLLPAASLLSASAGRAAGRQGAAPAADGAAAGGKADAEESGAEAVVFSGTIVISLSLLQAIRGELEKFVRQKALEAPRAAAGRGGAGRGGGGGGPGAADAAVGNDGKKGEEEEAGEKGRGGKGGKKGEKRAKGGKGRNEAEDAEEEEEAERGKKGGKGKGGKGKAGKGGEDVATANQQQRGSSKGDRGTNEMEMMPQGNAMALLLTGLHPDLAEAVVDEATDDYDDVNDDISSGSIPAPALPCLLVSALRPALAAAWAEERQRVNATVTAGSTTERRRQRMERVAAQVEPLLADLQLFAGGVEAFKEDPQTAALISRHILRSSALPPADLLLRAVLQDHGLLPDAASAAGAAAPPAPHGAADGPQAAASTGEDGTNGAAAGGRAPAGAASAPSATAGAAAEVAAASPPFAECAALASDLPDGVRQRVSALLEVLDGREVEAAVRALEAVGERDVGLRAKRMDRKAERAALFGLRKAFNKALQAPGRALSAVLARLQPSLPADAFQRLSSFHAQAVACLSAQAAQGAAGAEGDVQRRLEELRALLPGIKALAASGKQRGEECAIAT